MLGRESIGWAVAIGLGVSGLALGAAGQERLAVKESQDGTPGTYQGVCPGTDRPPAVAPQGSGGNEIMWPGFQMLPGGGSRVFVQATGPISTTARTEADKLLVSLGSARLVHENNGRPLITRYFNTPVIEASVDITAGQATLVLSLRSAVEPSIRTEQASATGYHFVYVDFPPGQYVEGAAPVADAASPAAPGATPGARPGARPKHLAGDAANRAAPAAGASASGSASGNVSAGQGKAEAKGKAKGKLSIGF